MALWFRFYAEALDDPKVQSLSPDLFKAWVNLLCVASKTSGSLPSIDQIAFHLRCDIETANAFHEGLVRAGLIDVGQKGSKIHAWDKRQYKSDTSTERVKRFRKRNETVSVTPPDTDTDTDTDTDISSLRSDIEPAAKVSPKSHLLSVLDEEHAVAVVDHRKRLRKPLTDRAAKLMARSLSEFADPNAAADKMIEKGWLSIDASWQKQSTRKPSSETGNPFFDRIQRNLQDEQAGREPRLGNDRDNAGWLPLSIQHHSE